MMRMLRRMARRLRPRTVDLAGIRADDTLKQETADRARLAAARVEQLRMEEAVYARSTGEEKP